MKKCIEILVVAIFLYTGCNSSSNNESVLDGSKPISRRYYSQFDVDWALSFNLHRSIDRLTNDFFINGTPYKTSIIIANDGLKHYALEVKIKDYGRQQYIFNLQVAGGDYTDNKCFLTVIYPIGYGGFIEEVTKRSKDLCGENCWLGGKIGLRRSPWILKADKSKKIIYAFVEGEWEM